jgi:hypothetical protein
MREQNFIPNNIEGTNCLIDWFGYWPDFHDAEVLELLLSRESTSHIKLHFWNTSSETNTDGTYKTNNDAIVTITMTDITDTDLQNFNHQNVIESLQLSKTEEGIKLELSPCYGVTGYIIATAVKFSIEPYNSRLTK